MQCTNSELRALWLCRQLGVRGGITGKERRVGGIFGVVNRQKGIAVYSAKLDAQGNSVRWLRRKHRHGGCHYPDKAAKFVDRLKLMVFRRVGLL